MTISLKTHTKTPSKLKFALNSGLTIFLVVEALKSRAIEINEVVTQKKIEHFQNLFDLGLLGPCVTFFWFRSAINTVGSEE